MGLLIALKQGSNEQKESLPQINQMIQKGTTLRESEVKITALQETCIHARPCSGRELHRLCDQWIHLIHSTGLF